MDHSLCSASESVCTPAASCSSRSPHACPHCGDAVTQPRTGRRVYCSPLCQGRAWRHRQNVPKTCPHCTAEFQPRRRSQTYCTDRCRYEAALRRLFPSPGPRPCIVCRRPFTPRRRQARYCSRRCLKRAWNRAHRKPHHGRRCLECGHPFRPKNSRNRFCSRTCLRRDGEKWSLRAVEARLRRVAKIRAKYAEHWQFVKALAAELEAADRIPRT